MGRGDNFGGDEGVQHIMPGGDSCPDCKHAWARHIKRGNRHQCMVRTVEQGSGNFEGCGCDTTPPAGYSAPSGSRSGRFQTAVPNYTERPEFYISDDPNGARYFINKSIVSQAEYESLDKIWNAPPKRERWIMHGDTAHKAGVPCRKCSKFKKGK